MVSQYYRETAKKRDVKITKVERATALAQWRGSHHGSEAGLPDATAVQSAMQTPPPATATKDMVALIEDNRESPRDRITGSEIRLLKLFPGHQDADLVANIEVFSFRQNADKLYKHSADLRAAREIRIGNKPRELPPGFKYEALSYTWGEGKIAGAIQILEGDKRFQI